VLQDDDFDAQKEKRSSLLGLIPDSVAEFIKKEAVLIALVTGISYYLTYRFHSSYLSYFGVTDTFVDLGLSKIITSAVGVVFLSISIYQMTSILPMTALGRFLEAIFVFPYLFFPLVFLILSIQISGYSYTSQAIALYLLFVGLLTGIWLRRKLRSGTLWRKIFQESVDQEKNIRPHFLGTAIADSRFGGVFLVALVLILATSLLGDWAGNRAAFRERDFLLLEFRDMEVGIIGTYNDQFIGVAIERVDEEASLTGTIFLIPPPSNSGSLLMKTTRMHIKKIEHPKRNSIEWVTFEDAWRRNSATIRGWISVQD
jgi:hypothetical protein